MLQFAQGVPPSPLGASPTDSKRALSAIRVKMLAGQPADQVGGTFDPRAGRLGVVG
jgi:hypothetical protein